MKKNFMFAMMGAIALTGAAGFTACSSSDDMVDENPTYNPVEKTVTTQFVLNIASGDMKETRQSADIVQKNDNFRGMEDAMLIGLKTDKVSSFLAPLTDASSVTVKQSYDLGMLYNSTSVDNANAGNDATSKNRNESSRRVVELTLPTGTDAMLVYGRAIHENGDAANGKVVVSIDKETVKNTTFSLVPRIGDNSTKYANTCEIAAIILNRILASSIEGKALPSSPSPRNGYTQKAALPALSWKELAAVDNISTLKPLAQNLSKAYKDMVAVYSNDKIHSGSAAAIANLMKDIYAIATSVSLAQATSDDELNAQLLADRILDVIGYYFDTSTFLFKALGSGGNESDPAYHLIANTSLTAVDFNSGGKYYDLDSYLQELPTKFDLPEGVAQLQMSAIETSGTEPNITISGGEFSYKAANASASLIDLSSTLNPAKYTYPAELLYFDNSLLRVNDGDKEPGDYPNGYNVWDTGSNSQNSDWWAGWTIGPVVSTTRSVAVKNNINYGVSMLQTNVTVDGTAFADNRDEDVKFTPAEVKKFKLTGVLIGGQYKQLGWNYLENGTTGNSDFVVYDNSINGNGGIPTDDDGNVPNYTLVFDNFTGGATGTQEDQQNVKVALEFQNSDDKDIYGVGGGIIPKGGTFYLVGELKIKESETSYKTISNWPTYYAIPPYTSAGGTNQITRVFIQDYVASATFKIGPNSLKYAYTTVPDLRASQTSLGLSVDLKWQPGLVFDDVILGGSE